MDTASPILKTESGLAISFLPVTEKNFAIVSTLRVATAQAGMVETVAQCCDEARQLSLWRPVAICVDKTPVGFAMYGLWKDEGENGRVWLDRFLIDERFQGKGYAKAVLPLLLRQMAAQYGCKKIYLSVYENNQVAINLYKSLSFAFTGERDINGELVMSLPLST